MSIIGKKTKFQYLEKITTTNGRGRQSVSWTSKYFIYGILSGVKHYGSGSKDEIIQNQLKVAYYYELLLNKRDVNFINEEDRIKDVSSGIEYEIQQIIINGNNKGNILSLQLLRLK